MNKHKYLEGIWNQIPPDYYEEGRKKNYLQKIWHGEKVNKLKPFLSPKYKKILDIGSGSGHITHEIKKFLPNSEIWALDVYDKAINFGKKKYKDINFICADAHNLPFPEESFDLIISTESLEHVCSPEGVLSEMRRVLKKNGEIIVEMDSGNSIFKLVWSLWTRIGPGKVWRKSHLTIFNSRKLKKMIIDAGFIIKKSKISHFGMGIIYEAKKSI